MKHANWFADGKLHFLEGYQYDLEEEELLPFGASQYVSHSTLIHAVPASASHVYRSFEAGGTAFKRYSFLISEKNLPFVRASGKRRVIHSAANWTVGMIEIFIDKQPLDPWTSGLGFAAASHQHINPTIAVIIPENQNNTLNNHCPNAKNGTKEKGVWLKAFATPIAKRLEEAAPGTSLSNQDVFNLMAMCPFESMTKERISEFCLLFTDDEFKQFEYHGDVEKYYKTG